MGETVESSCAAPVEEVSYQGEEDEENEEEGRLKERLLERTEELTSIRTCMETTMGVVNQLEDTFKDEDVEEQERAVQLIQKQLREVQDCWEEEKESWERELDNRGSKLKYLVIEGQEKAKVLGMEWDSLKAD